MSSEKISTQPDMIAWLIIMFGIGVFLYTYQVEIIQVVAILLALVFFGLFVYGFFILYANRLKSFESILVEEVPVALAETPSLKPAISFRMSREEKQKRLLELVVHSVSALSVVDRSFLLTCGFEVREFVPLGRVRREQFFIKRQPPKSLEHTFLIESVRGELLKRGIDVGVTLDGDVDISYNGREYGLCVVVPADLKKRARLLAKAKRLTDVCGVNWWFVVSQSAYARGFRRYGDVLTRNQVLGWVEGTFGARKVR